LLLLPVLALAPGCGDEPPPVAVVEVESSGLELPHRRFVALDLSWRIQQPLAGHAGQLYVFVHLRDEQGSVLRTFDYLWPGSWQTSSRVEHRVTLHQSALGPPLDPGVYALTFGLYDGEGRRWPLTTAGELVDRHEYRIAEVRVPPVSGNEPMFQFSSDWLDSEPGRDRQVLARRWLTGAGQVGALGLERPGELWLRLLLPTPGDQQELVLAEGASQQAAVVRTDCGEVEVRLAGAGSHDVVLPISPAAAGEACAIEITPNFYLLELESAKRRAVALDGLAWAANGN
jgi:hypothetical protein